MLLECADYYNVPQSRKFVLHQNVAMCRLSDIRPYAMSMIDAKGNISGMCKLMVELSHVTVLRGQDYSPSDTHIGNNKAYFLPQLDQHVIVGFGKQSTADAWITSITDMPAHIDNSSKADTESGQSPETILRFAFRSSDRLCEDMTDTELQTSKKGTIYESEDIDSLYNRVTIETISPAMIADNSSGQLANATEDSRSF